MNVIRQMGRPVTPLFARWTKHDGARMPVPPDSWPGVEFRNGWRVPPDTYLASDWVRATGNLWVHEHGTMDIVSFLLSADRSPAARTLVAIRATILAHHRHGTTEWINDELARDVVELVGSTIRVRRERLSKLRQRKE